MATIRSGSSTAKGRLEEELERSREDLEDFFENGTVALHWVAADGSILRVNQAELDLLGYKREEYVGRHIAEFHADPPVIEDILARLTRGEKLDKYEARLKAKDGSIKYVLISSNVRFREGRFINTRCFSLDVTELKKLENALRESEQRRSCPGRTISAVECPLSPADRLLSW
jgi:PAS domain S-box-containing protein